MATNCITAIMVDDSSNNSSKNNSSSSKIDSLIVGTKE